MHVHQPTKLVHALPASRREAQELEREAQELEREAQQLEREAQQLEQEAQQLAVVLMLGTPMPDAAECGCLDARCFRGSSSPVPSRTSPHTMNT